MLFDVSAWGALEHLGSNQDSFFFRPHFPLRHQCFLLPFEQDVCDTSQGTTVFLYFLHQLLSIPSSTSHEYPRCASETSFFSGMTHPLGTCRNHLPRYLYCNLDFHMVLSGLRRGDGRRGDANRYHLGNYTMCCEFEIPMITEMDHFQFRAVFSLLFEALLIAS